MGPFMTVCLINSVFDAFRLGSLIHAGIVTLLPSVSIPLLASIIFQMYSFVTCLGVYKDMLHPFDSPLPRTGADTRPFLQRDQQRSGFVPFGGEGRRLG